MIESQESFLHSVLFMSHLPSNGVLPKNPGNQLSSSIFNERIHGHIFYFTLRSFPSSGHYYSDVLETGAEQGATVLA